MKSGLRLGSTCTNKNLAHVYDHLRQCLATYSFNVHLKADGDTTTHLIEECIFCATISVLSGHSGCRCGEWR